MGTWNLRGTGEPRRRFHGKESSPLEATRELALGGDTWGVQSRGYLHGSFRKLGVPDYGVLIIRILLLDYDMGVPYFRNLPHSNANGQTLQHPA